MSIPLPTTNLAGVNVGQSGIVSFANIGVSAGGVSANPANTKNAGTILIYNESGSGLMIQFQTSRTGFYLPAGGWQPVQILSGESGFEWTVLYNLPNPPVTLLLVTYFYPGEAIPNVPILGNSPIGIGGTVQVAGPFTFISVPFQFVSGDSISGGSSKLYQVSGGATGVPSNAVMVFITLQAASASVGTYVQVAPSGGFISGISYPQVEITQTTSIQSFGSLAIPVNLIVLDGKIEILANNNNITNLNGFIYGYSL